MSTTTRQADGTAAAYRYDYTGNRVVKMVSHGVDTETTIYVDKFAEVRDGQYIQHVYAGDRRVARVSKAFDPALFLADAKVLTFDDFDLNKDGIISLDEIRRQGSDAQVMEIPEVRDALKIFKEKLAGDTDALPFAVMAAACREVGLPTQVTPAVYFYVPDHLGSSSIMTNAAGQVVEESVYYPYGMNRARSGGFEAEYRFTGKELDDENDLHYFGARYYDAMVGRFVSVDPLMVDIYNYAKNNPVIFIDLAGLIPMNAMIDTAAQTLSDNAPYFGPGLDANLVPPDVIEQQQNSLLLQGDDRAYLISRLAVWHDRALSETKGFKDVSDPTVTGAHLGLGFGLLAVASYDLVFRPYSIDKNSDIILAGTFLSLGALGVARQVEQNIVEKPAHYISDKGSKAAHYISDKGSKAAHYISDKGSKAAHYISDKGSKAAPLRHGRYHGHHR
jgi:RHS repeat-associated protein